MEPQDTYLHDFEKEEILTGGTFNPEFLQMLANKFNLTVLNVFDSCLNDAVIFAIDFFNKNTSNCFYALPKDYKLENIYLLKKKEELIIEE
jgi:pantothenate kinase